MYSYSFEFNVEFTQFCINSTFNLTIRYNLYPLIDKINQEVGKNRCMTYVKVNKLTICVLLVISNVKSGKI